MEEQVTGIILRTIPSRDSDLILRVISKERGKISVYARHARHSKKRYQGGLDVLDHGQFSLLDKRLESNLLNLVSFLPQNCFFNLRDDLDRLSCALLISEALDHLIPDSCTDDGEFYELLVNALNLFNSESEPASILRILGNSLERLLDISGLLDSNNGTVISPKYLAFLISSIQNHTGKQLATAQSVYSTIKRFQGKRNQAVNE